MVNPKTSSIFPPELLSALSSSEKARLIFEELAPDKRKTFVDWVAEAKKEGTRKERARKAVMLLEASASTIDQ
ncbi:MAG: YdeI/OmpD-associated family protein [Bacteroidales bacterium]